MNVRITLLLVLSALFFYSPSAFGKVLLTGIYYDAAAPDIWVKTLSGRVGVQRTWHDGKWSFNRSWNKLILQYNAAKVVSIDRNGDIYKPAPGQAGLFLYGATRSIREIPTGLRWQNRKGDWIKYDSLGRITSYGDERNLKVTMGYDVIGRVISIFDDSGRQVLWFSYDTIGHLTGIRGIRGQVLQYDIC